MLASQCEIESYTDTVMRPSRFFSFIDMSDATPLRVNFDSIMNLTESFT